MKSKKWLALLLSAAFVVPLAIAGCDNGNAGGGGGTTPPPPAPPTSVSAPTVSMTGNILSWNEVKDAECYSVHYILDGQDFLISEKQQGTTFVFTPTEVGEYSFYVVAINQTYNLVSENSATVSFIYEADSSVALASDAKIYLVGDSTVCSFSDNYYLPRYGYGTQLYNYINCEPTQIKNLALSGRSSKSFINEGNYTTLKNGLKEGDYLIIGFGHNDEKSDDADRFTSAKGDKDTAGSFQNSLYENYIKLAEEKNATPILCTPIVRYDSTGSYTGAKVHSTADGDYAQAIKDLGAATGTTVVDLTGITKELYKADNNAAQYFHAATSYKGEKPNEAPTGRDDTHINKYGAKTIAYYLANAIKESNLPLKDNIITNSLAPCYEVDYPDAINASYVRPPYYGFDENSAKAAEVKLTEITTNDTTSNWYKTVMGDVGGASKLTTYTISYANEKFTVGNTANNGKFTDSQDGFGAAFMQIDASKNFTAKATVKVVSVGGSANNQSAFGMMLRDDIYVNTYSTEINSNFVAAGLLNTKGAIFSHENGKISGVEKTATVAANNTYQLEIKRVGQAVTVKVDSTTKTYTDFDFVAIDNGYMYLCLFANRGIVAEFTNVQFEITGNSQGA